jgi:hypothetical protein
MVRQKGEALVTNVAEQKTFVEDVLSLQTKSEHILRNSFYNQVRGEICCYATFEEFNVYKKKR